MPDSVQRPPAPSAPPGGMPHAQPSAYSAADSDIHILDRLAVVYRYRRIAAAVFVLTTAAMMIQGYTTLKMYRAQARLLIEDERSTAVPGVSADNFYEDPDLYYKTQYRILRGRDLTRRVVQKLNLGSNPELNGTAVRPSKQTTMFRHVEKMF